MFLHPHHFTKGDKELSELVVSQMFRFFASSLVAIFIPIYLWELGYAFEQIFFFLALHFVFLIPLFFLGLHAVKHFGFKHMIALSIPLTMLNMYLLLSLETLSIPLPFVSFVFSFATAMYWAGAHADIARNSSKKRRGKQIAMIQASRIGLMIISPLLGAGIITLFGYANLFRVVIFLLLCSLLPFLFSKDRHYSFHFDWNMFWKGHNTRDAFFYFFEGFHAIGYTIVWPLFIFLVGISLVPLGLMFTIATFLQFFVTLFIGKRVDDGKDTLRFGAFLQMVLFAAVGFFKTLIPLGVLTALRNVTNPLLMTPFEKVYYDKARRLSGIYVREFWLSLGRMCYLFTLILVFFVVGEAVLTLQIGFGLAALGALLMGGFK